MVSVQDNQLTLEGPILMDGVNAILQAARVPTGQDALTIDLSRVTEVDSSALALLLQWTREAAGSDRPIKLVGVPSSLTTLADLYGVRALLNLRAC
jgi:phospholipid transport system transporter-binding protein